MAQAAGKFLVISIPSNGWLARAPWPLTHPAISALIVERASAHAGSDRVVVLDAALPFDTGPLRIVGRMVVDVDPDLAVARLVLQRGFSEDDARARIRNQLPRAERVAQADFVIDNSGTPEDLDREVDRAWAWIASLPESA